LVLVENSGEAVRLAGGGVVRGSRGHTLHGLITAHRFTCALK
jgi:hypothetical protein